MLTSLIFFITAFISLQMFSQMPAPSPLLAISGTAGLIGLAWFSGKLRINQLLSILRETGNPDDPRLLRMFMQWKTVFQFTVIIMYVSSLVMFRWGSLINNTFGLKRWILVDEILGLLPYFVLLLVFWSLSYRFQNRVSREKWTYRGYILFNIHITLIPILPLFMFVALSDALFYLPPPLNRWVGSGDGIGDFLLAFVFLGFIGFIFPLLLVKFWKCRSMEPGEKRYLMESVCRAKKLDYNDIMIWDIGEGKFLNAAVLGVSRHFRYILFTRRILEVMDDRELIAILGHEIGHAKKHHILMNIVITFGFLSFFLIGTETVTRKLAELMPQFAWMISFISTIAIVVLYWRVIFGFLSRRFERQADIYGAETAGSTEPMITALEKLAVVSGRPREVPDWTHYSIAERVEFLESIESDPVRMMQFNEETASIMKKFVFAAAVMFTVSLGAMFSHAGAGEFPLDRMFELKQYADIEKYLLTQLDKEDITAPEKASSSNNLAWLYATSSDSDFRRPALALSYAEEAVSITRQMMKAASTEKELVIFRYYLAIYTDTLAAAYFAAGDTDEALRQSERALELFPSEHNFPGIEDLIETYEKHRRAVLRGDTYI